MSFSSDSDDDDVFEIESEEIRETAKNASTDLFSKASKSKQLYISTYNTFNKWREEKGHDSYSEDVLMAYFESLSAVYAPSSLWPIYSMLKATINTFHQIDVSQFTKLVKFIKDKNIGYIAKRSLLLTKENISQFLSEAPDHVYLSTKVALIFGILGALRRQEFANLLISDVIEGDDFLLVKININKNKVPRSFTIAGGLYDICKQYMRVRPKPCNTDRFFLKYAKGKCHQQPIGVNKFGSMAKEVASYLNLPDADKFTGHSFRMTSATLLVDAEADITRANKKRVHDQLNSGISTKKIKITNVAKLLRSESTPSTSIQQMKSVAVDRHLPVATKSSCEIPSSTSDILEVTLPKAELDDSDSSIFDSNSDQTPTICEENQIEQPHITTVDSPVKQNSTSEQTCPVFNDSEIDFKSLNLPDDDRPLVFYNCNVKLEGYYKSIVLNNCNIYK